MPGRGLVYRDERFPTGVCDAHRSRTARSSPQGGGAKGWKANARPKEHKWAVRQDVGGEQANTREARESVTAPCRAQRRERKEQALTRGDPGVEKLREVSRGHSSAGGRHEQKGVPMQRAEGPNRANRGAGTGDKETNEAAGRDHCGPPPPDWRTKAQAEQPPPAAGVDDEKGSDANGA